MSNEFFKAIKQGEISKVEQMIERNPSLANAKNIQGTSAVVLATYFGKLEIIEMLISKGAKLSLFEASMTGRTQIVKDALTHDPNAVNSFSSDGFTALHLAAFFGHLETARVLVENGADVNAVAKNTMKVAPLHSAVARNQLEISELLLEHGARVNAKQEGGFAPLHEAAQNGNLEIAKLLLEHGANINFRTDRGKTPFDLTKEEAPEAGPKEKRESVAHLLVQWRRDSEKTAFMEATNLLEQKGKKPRES